jgi:phosphoribosylformimino-5-aminoimidazole carboxamide ribotide isomerase
MMEFYAAIDLRGGQAVRLFQGDYGRETGYGDPIHLAEEFIGGGTDWLHLVDLDGARGSSSANRSIIKEIAAMSPVPVEVGGGIRTMSDVDELVSSGVHRVILGTVAVEERSLAQELTEAFPGHVAVGLDYRSRNDKVVIAVRGWLEGAEMTLAEGLEQTVHEGTAAVILTSIDRDGTLEGPDLDGLQEALRATSVPVVASAGVGSIEDLLALRGAGDAGSGRSLAGVVVGKALVEGRFTVGEGVRACR